MSGRGGRPLDGWRKARPVIGDLEHAAVGVRGVIAGRHAVLLHRGLDELLGRGDLVLQLPVPVDAAIDVLVELGAAAEGADALVIVTGYFGDRLAQIVLGHVAPGGLEAVGWVGPVFWPYAYNDFFDFVFWPYVYDDFWPYVYDDVYFGIYGPYAYSGPGTKVARGATTSVQVNSKARTQAQRKITSV